MYFQKLLHECIYYNNKTFPQNPKDFISAALIVSSVWAGRKETNAFPHWGAKTRRSHELLRTGWAEASLVAAGGHRPWAQRASVWPGGPSVSCQMVYLSWAGWRPLFSLSVVTWDLCDDYSVLEGSHYSHKRTNGLFPTRLGWYLCALSPREFLFVPCGLEKNHEFSLIQVFWNLLMNFSVWFIEPHPILWCFLFFFFSLLVAVVLQVLKFL